MSTFANRAPLLILVACFPVSNAVAAQGQAGPAGPAAVEAEQLARQGAYESAETLLAEIDCGDQAACQVVLDFSNGWLQTQWAAVEPGQGHRLELARDHYRRALERRPTNPRILINYLHVTRDLGRIDEAIIALDRLIEVQDRDAYRYLVLRGDLLARQEQFNEALASFKAAIDMQPGNPIAHRHVIDMYRKQGNSLAVFEYSTYLQHDHPEVAASGLAVAIANFVSSDTRRADDALIQWTAINADLGVLEPATLADLPAPDKWHNPALIELYDAVHADLDAPMESGFSWWSDGAESRDALARVLRSRALTYRRDADRAEPGGEERVSLIQKAMMYLREAAELAPPYKAYLDSNLSRSTIVRLDAVADLIALHDTVKQDDALDALVQRSSVELDEMTGILFSGKSGAYAAGQLEAIQRYHTILGMIYYRSGRFSSDWADNATYQLQHAIKTAEHRASSETARFAPVPEIQMLLADVYSKSGREQDSSEVYVRAAIGYLSADNLPEARHALDRATVDGRRPPGAASVASVLAGRLAISVGAMEMLERSGEGNLVISHDSLNWLGDPTRLDLPREFVEGQRFKVLADLGRALDEQNEAESARLYYQEALEAYQEEFRSTSPTDSRRLQGIEVAINPSRQDIYNRPLREQTRLRFELGAPVETLGDGNHSGPDVQVREQRRD